MISFWFRRIQFVIYRLDNIFSKTHVAQLMVLKIKFFCQRDIRSANSTSYHVKKLKIGNGRLFLCDAWSRYLEKLQCIHTETC